MDTIFCDITALRLHRMPPCVIELIENELDRIAVPGRTVLREQTVLDVLLPKPIHLLRFDRSSSFRSTGLIAHVWTGEESRVFQGFTALTGATTLEFTLLQLANRLSLPELIMLVSEFCGSFTTCRLPQMCWDEVAGRLEGRTRDLGRGWRVVCDGAGNPTSLVRRDPLLTKHQLASFARYHSGTRGARRLLKAAELAFEDAASPLEVRAAMLIGLPCLHGGSGYTDLRLNARVDLDVDARIVSGRSRAYADILIERGTQSVVIECQSSLIHESRGAYISDGKRATALQKMGYKVVLITDDQLKDSATFDILVSYLDKELGVRRRLPGKRILSARSELRRVLFQAWEDLGVRSYR